MTDPLNDAILTHPETRKTASGLVMAMTEGLPDDSPLYALLSALTSTFVGLCDDQDIDPSAAFAQIADTLTRDTSTLPQRGGEAHDVPVSLN